ncbi:MAG: efflux RND transporter permease subunit, partial [Deltaproteobacteria bacterium]|nr:efflux RND transporter permease subunit [Deltaproteobacteria bacterium]
TKDLQQATQDIRDKISEIRQELPTEMEEPILTRFDPNDLPILSITLSSATASAGELTRLADPWITGELQGVPGVAQVNVVGGMPAELTVELIPGALEASGVSVGQVVAALQAANLAAPVGRVENDRMERSIRLQGRLEAPSDFEAIAVTSSNGRLVRLGDVATVKAGTEEARSMALFNSEEAVGIDVVKATGYSTTAVSADAQVILEEIRQKLPEGVELNLVRDSGERVADSVEGVEHTLIEGAILTVLVVFLFLNSWRSTVITGLALPVSVIASFIAVWAFGFTLNSMSLLGLSMAIGILVDDAIVVRENIVRHVEMGKDHLTAAREGTAEIGLAVAATTFSIIIVFVPVAFMGGLAEQFLGPMALTIAASVAVSLFVSFSLDPMLSAYWPDPVVAREDQNLLTRTVGAFNRAFDRQTDRYKSVIRWALNHRVAMVAIAALAFGGALAMPISGLVGTSFFPVQDRSEFLLNLELPPGTSLAYTQAKVVEAAKIAGKHEGVRYTYSTIGGRGGTVNEATIYVRLTKKNERDVHADDIATAARDEIDQLAGVLASVGTGGFGHEKQIQLQLQGPDVAVLADLADRLAAEVATVPGAVDVGLSTGGQKPELEVRLDRSLSSSLGLSVGSVAQALRPAFAGVDVGDWIDPSGETREVRVRLTPESRTRPQDLESLPLTITGPNGPATVPLGQVAEITLGKGPAQIEHLGRSRVIVVEANARGPALSAVMSGIEAKIDAFVFPPGYTIRQGGDVERQADVFGRMLGALGVAIVMMYFVLVVQFGSFVEPISIMASLPLSLIGVMLALLVSGSTVNLMSMIGILLLMGIVAKNAILLVDFAKWAEERGMPRKEAIIEAGGTRLRPILMTTVAIVAGMIPVALGSGEGADFRKPLGLAVIGGVITSTLLTLLVIPTFYDMLTSWRDAVIRRFAPGLAPAHPVAHAPDTAPSPAK